MYLIGNGYLITHDPSLPFMKNGAVLIEGDAVRDVGDTGKLSKAYPKAQFIDAEGGVIMPGLINAHTHFYSAALRGYSVPGFHPGCFADVLLMRSWRLDRELDFRDSVNAAYASAMEAVKNGVTTVFDHHAGYGSVSGSLMGVAGAAGAVGLRACCCFETSCRLGYSDEKAAEEENENFIAFCEKQPSGMLKAMFGLHAPFTLTESSLKSCAARNAGRTGFHIHVSESGDDAFVSTHTFGQLPAELLKNCGILGGRTILAHCVHTTQSELDTIAESGSFVVNNPQSNMSNAVGCADAKTMLSKGIKLCLGTDNFTPDMLESARAFITAQRDKTGDPSFGLNEAAKLLFENNRLLAEEYFGKGIGTIRPGAPADIIIMDYKPYTPIDESNYPAHVLMGMSGRNCVFTMAAGRILMRGRKLLTVDEAALAERIGKSTAALWERISAGEAMKIVPAFMYMMEEKMG
jgi:putative selenium metabolism protein SsnA